MFPGRIALATVVDLVPKREQNEDGNQTCGVFTAKLKIFAKSIVSSPSTAFLNEISAQTFEVINTNAAPVIVGEQIIVAQGPDERWFTLQRPHPKFQFVTLGKIVNRSVQVKVLRTMNAPPNLDVQGRFLEYGDTLTIYDPFNLWSDIEPEATGWAYLAYAQDDDTETSEINEQHVIRYEIEECSLPVNEIKAKLRDCLMGGMTQGVALVQMNSAVRSTYPNVDHPPSSEIPDPENPAVSTEVEVNFYNPLHLDGVGHSECILRRVTNKLVSDPENYTAPTPRSSTGVQWEVVNVAKKIARHIEVKFDPASGSDWQKESVYDGYDPTESPESSSGCEIEIVCPLCKCDDLRQTQGDKGYAFLDTTAATIKYYVYSTLSSFYPEPKKHKILAKVDGGEGGTDPLLEFDSQNCEIDYKYVNAHLLCFEEPITEQMPIPTTQTQVTTCDNGSLVVKECIGTCVWRWTGDPDWEIDTPCSDPYGIGCDCSKPAIPDPAPVVGHTEQSNCFGTPRLCLTMGTAVVKHIDCGAPTTGTCEVACIPLDDATSTPCPDPCEAIVP